MTYMSRIKTRGSLARLEVESAGVETRNAILQAKKELGNSGADSEKAKEAARELAHADVARLEAKNSIVARLEAGTEHVRTEKARMEALQALEANDSTVVTAENARVRPVSVSSSTPGKVVPIRSMRPTSTRPLSMSSPAGRLSGQFSRSSTFSISSAISTFSIPETVSSASSYPATDSDLDPKE